MLSLSTLPVFNSFILLYSSHLSLVLVVSLQLKPSEVSRCCFQHFNKAVFCITTILYVIYSLSIHISKSFVTLSRAPITAGSFYRFESPQSSNLSLQVLGLFHFFLFTVPYSYVSCYSNINDYTLSLILVSYNYVCLLASITFSH